MVDWQVIEVVEVIDMAIHLMNGELKTQPKPFFERPGCDRVAQEVVYEGWVRVPTSMGGETLP